ncbi:hypothetical protein [Butyrivibrio sp. MC2013]|uniref:hypothetical protein n=1 Tax=Butyrivibrio sp. MC2013 TaxID=1280686 RepID=UPI0003FE1C5C|nr:hypothetical protein [Butyrivibrio sp. MC2013]
MYNSMLLIIRLLVLGFVASLIAFISDSVSAKKNGRKRKVAIIVIFIIMSVIVGLIALAYILLLLLTLAIVASM